MDEIAAAIRYAEDCIGSVAARAVLLMATRDLERRMEDLSNAYAVNDARKTRAAAHALAGTLATFGLEKAAGLCRQAMATKVEASTMTECARAVSEVVFLLNQAYQKPSD